MTLAKIFKKNKNIIIGAIHLPPLLGYKDFPGFDVALKNALADLKAFESGGVDGIIFENNYDIPHKIFVGASIISSMTFFGEKLRGATRLPIGVSVLWNDYCAAFAIAKTINAQFIRLPVFVDTVRTSYGVVRGDVSVVREYRKSIDAEQIALFTDIHVKHSVLLSHHTIEQSAQLAKKNGADGVIVTGRWTGDAPDFLELKRTRHMVGNFPILAGSGVDKSNIRKVFKIANGVIVSTALKGGKTRKGEVNVKGYGQRILKKKVAELIQHASLVKR